MKRKKRRPTLTEEFEIRTIFTWFRWKTCSKCSCEFRREKGQKYCLDDPFAIRVGTGDIVAFLCEECSGDIEWIKKEQKWLNQKWLNYKKGK